jgi:phosphotransferase system enzyme I (PtsI)
MGQAGGHGEHLHGTGVSPGIAIGRALVLEGAKTTVFRLGRSASETEFEVLRFRRAICGAWRQIRGLRDRVRSEAGASYARVFEAQILILKDRALFAETVSLIRREQVNAEWAFHTVVGRFTEVFRQLGDADLKGRGTDIEDVETRVQTILGGTRRIHDLAQLGEEVILIAPTLSPSEVAGLSRTRVIGLAIDTGGPASHTAIIATALGIPTVAGLREASLHLRSGDLVALDGSSGAVACNPGESELEEWRARHAHQAQRDLDRAALRDLPASTRDGVRVTLMANIELLEATIAARRVGAEGIGLYRSEFLQLHESLGPPDEETHYRAYRELAESALPNEVVIRTLDISDDPIPGAHADRRETNPVLGLRAIRLSLRNLDIFRAQLRGIFRAAAHGKVRLLLPMVSALEELRQARQVMEQVAQELSREQIPFDPNIPVGVMMEVPGTVIMADRFATEVDFFSIGTNDLIQYALAIDRTNESVSFLYRPFHPAILRLIRRVVEVGDLQGIRVSVCGEMAADPLAAAVLLGLGVTELSMTPSAIPGVKEIIRSLSMRQARTIAEEALRLDTANEIETMVRHRVLSMLPAEYACPL